MENPAQTVFAGQAWLNFVRGCQTSATAGVYINTLQHYLKYMKMESPENLLKGTKELMENQIIDYIQSQKQRELSSGVIRMRLSAIKLFYDMNRTPLSWEYVRRTIGTTKKRKDRAYKIEELRTALNAADLRAKAAILMLASTGMRVGALADLRKKHLITVDKYGIYKIIVYEGYKEEYHTYCTPECRKAVMDYFEFRVRSGEKLTEESPVIREAFDQNDHFHAHKAIPVGVRGLQFVIAKAMIKSGVRTPHKMLEGQYMGTIRHEVKQAHGLRKFYDTAMTNAGINLLWIEMLEGHDTKLKDSYFRPSETDLLEGNNRMHGYVAAIDYLTIDPAQRLSKENEVLKEELKNAPKMEVVMNALDAKDLEIKRLERQSKLDKEEAERKRKQDMEEMEKKRLQDKEEMKAMLKEMSAGKVEKDEPSK